MKNNKQVQPFVLAEFYRTVMGIVDENVLRDCVEISTMMVLKAGQVLFPEGSVPTQVCFIWDGVIRGYSHSNDGKEITDCISFRRGDSAMPESEFDLPASITMEALVETEVVCVPVESLLHLMKIHPELNKIYYMYLLRSVNIHRGLKKAIYEYSAQQRYEWFLKEYPGLINRIPHKYIASLLNMTAVTLSNVRRALKEEHTEEEKNVHLHHVRI